MKGMKDMKKYIMMIDMDFVDLIVIYLFINEIQENKFFEKCKVFHC